MGQPFKMLVTSARRCEGRAVRYGNTPSGVTARALTQDDDLHPVRSQSNVVALRGRRIFTICWTPKRPGSSLPESATTVPVRSQDCAKGRRRRLDLVRRPGVSTDAVAVQSGHSSGSVPIFGCVGLTSRNVRFAAVPCNDRFAESQDDALRITCLLRFVLAQGVVDRLPFSPPLFGVGVEPWMDRTVQRSRTEMLARKGWLYRLWIDVKPGTSSPDDGHWGDGRLIGLSKDGPGSVTRRARMHRSQGRMPTASRQHTRCRTAR
jgi:hypothetical protein